MNNTIWPIKYRPASLATYVTTPEFRAILDQMISKQDIPNILLSGTPGIGKSTLARILVSELQVEGPDLLYIDASEENNAEVIRTKIKDFVVTDAFGKIKIVYLEEADHLSQTAQAILRGLMENYTTNVRFILTMNYEHRIIDAIKSRCSKLDIPAPPKDDLFIALAKILVAEGIKATKTTVLEHIDGYYPDMRGMLNSMQLCSKTGTLSNLSGLVIQSEWKQPLMTAIQNNDWQQARNVACSSISGDDFLDMYRFLYQKLPTIKKFAKTSAMDSAILAIAETMYRHTTHPDAEINAASLFISLSLIN